MIELGVDEITIVLHNTLGIIASSTQWEVTAETIINTFAQKADLINIFGIKVPEDNAPAGYTVAYHYGAHAFYFATAYHPTQPSMQVVVKFSAQALDYYIENSKMKLYRFWHMITSDIYKPRLSRIDLTADYIDLNVDPTLIYQNLVNRKIDIYDKFAGKTPDTPILRKRNLSFRGFAVKDEIPTIYVGAPSSDCQLRIYDKKREQVERAGSKLAKALNCSNWTRFECTLSKRYAHQMSDALSNIYTDTEFANLIASVIVQKFRFMDIDSKGNPDVETDFTQALIDCVSNNDFQLRASSTKNYDLAKNIEYLYHGSGILGTLHKVQEIWGTDAVWELLAHTLDILEDYEVNDSCAYWEMRNADDYKKQYPAFVDFLTDNLPTVISTKEKGSKEFSIPDAPNPTILYDWMLQDFESNSQKLKKLNVKY